VSRLPSATGKISPPDEQDCPQAFAEASRHTLIIFGAINTAVLLISSTVMAFAVRAWLTNAFQNHDTPIDLLGIYWHFVDIVWVFLFPLIYLVDRHG
jgi:heme/copper-type cytochrome/quinol oxidase subunit 3